MLNKQDKPSNFTKDDEAFLKDLVGQISDFLDLILRKEELAQRNVVLEAQIQELSSFDYLIKDRTAINTLFRYNRKVHYWRGLVGLVLLALMAVTSLLMIRFDSLRQVMVGLHTVFGLGFRYYYYTDITIGPLFFRSVDVCLPPLTSWLKVQKASTLLWEMS